MKVLVVSNLYPSKEFPSYGVFVKNFAKELDAIGVDYKLSVLNKKRGKFRLAWEYIKFYFKTIGNVIFGKEDLVYVHYASHSSLPVLIGNFFRRKPVYLNVHGGDVVPRTTMHKVMHVFTKRMIKKATKVVVPSEYFSKLMQEKYHLPEDKIFVYPSGGVDIKFFESKPKQTREETLTKLGLDPSKTYYGNVGRIEPGKEWRDLMDGIYLGLDEPALKDVHWIIVGTGVELKDFMKRRAEKGLEDRMFHIEQVPQDDLLELYHVMELFCFPNGSTESLGLVGLEAMACQVPLLTSDVASPSLYSTDGVDSLHYRFGDPESVKEKLVEFAELPAEKKAEMGRMARENVRKYEKSRTRDRLKDLILRGGRE